MSKSKNISKEHVIRHMKEMNAGWMRSGSTGLTANVYAMLLGLDVETVVKYLQEEKYTPFFCDATQAVVWSREGGFSGNGYNEDGDPIDDEEFQERLNRQNKLGPGVVDNGFFKPGRKRKGTKKRSNGLFSYEYEIDMIGSVCGMVGAVLPKEAPTEKVCVHCLYQIPCCNNNGW